ncbi:Glutathione S-transferase 2 [Aphelenchoides fujianensis]|nr:Glutathione S-transferase 2 [Aphelenchoides fujianensis]
MSMKLYYFDVRNLAEMSRMILHYGNVPFEDVRVDQSEWPELKTKMLYGKLPVLEVHGKQLGESCAIARYLARKQGKSLAGKDEWAQAKVDELMHVQKDFYKEVAPFYYAAAGFGEVDKPYAHRSNKAE